MAVPSRLPLAVLPPVLALLLCSCVPAAERPSWRVYPLPRQRPGDGLAVVTRPRGEGLHLWLDVHTGTKGLCEPIWNPDGARLRGGDGAEPTSLGRAPRDEFFQAMAHGPVRLALRQQMELLCRERAPESAFRWQPPPRGPGDLPPERLPLWEAKDLLSHPRAVRRAEKQLLGQPLSAEDWEEHPLPPPPEGP
ncbi:MAG: hypothetical protein VKO39_05085 [Cyanobacteriota bacterium]|nr:hypothetical protein [Cyanobacteriota bacterium]